ncbi:unnamed protein product, partial [Polarella glacialis]
TSTSLLRDMLDVIDREGRWPDGLSRPALLPAVGGDPFQPEVPSEIAGSASAGVPSHRTSNQPEEEERWRSPPQTPPPRPKRSSSPGARMVLTQGSSAAAQGREMAKLGSPIYVSNADLPPGLITLPLMPPVDDLSRTAESRRAHLAPGASWPPVRQQLPLRPEIIVAVNEDGLNAWITAMFQVVSSGAANVAPAIADPVYVRVA